MCVCVFSGSGRSGMLYLCGCLEDVGFGVSCVASEAAGMALDVLSSVGMLSEGASMYSPSSSSCPSSKGRIVLRHFKPTPSGGVILSISWLSVFGGVAAIQLFRKETISSPTNFQRLSVTRWSSEPSKAFLMKLSLKARGMSMLRLLMLLTNIRMISSLDGLGMAPEEYII